MINDITAADLDATVNFLGEDTSKNPDLFAYDVQVSCSTHNNVWCYNAPQVNIRKTAKEGSAKQSSASGNASSKTN